MGIYTTSNRFSGNVYDYAAEIPANEAYDAAFGCAHILADCQANDMALFESTIYSDMQEVMAIQEGYEVVNENAFTNVLKKIAEMFKKLVAKIKGIFKAFIAKLEGMFKNGKDLVKKYEKQILKYSNWKKFKIKGIRRPKGKATDVVSLINKVFDISNGSKNIGDMSRYTLTSASAASSWKVKVKDTEKTPEDITKADAEDIREALLKVYMANKNYDYKDFSTEVSDEIYDDEDTIDGDDDSIGSSFFTSEWIKGVLNDKKLITDAEKLNKKLDDNINGIIDNLNKTHDNLAKFMMDNKGADVEGGFSFGSSAVAKDGSYKDKNATEWKAHARNNGTTIDKATYDRLNSAQQGFFHVDPDDSDKYVMDTNHGNEGGTKDVQKVIQAMQKIASNEQEVVTKVTSEYMSQLKFAVSQARKLWTAAAAYTSTEHKEDASYYQAVGECAAEQAYQKLESLHS